MIHVELAYMSWPQTQVLASLAAASARVEFQETFSAEWLDLQVLCLSTPVPDNGSSEVAAAAVVATTGAAEVVAAASTTGAWVIVSTGAAASVVGAGASVVVGAGGGVVLVVGGGGGIYVEVGFTFLILDEVLL